MQNKTGSWNMKVECSEELTRDKDHLCVVTEFLMSCIVSKSYKSTLVVANITNCLLLNAILKKSLFNGRINLSTYCLAWLLNSDECSQDSTYLKFNKKQNISNRKEYVNDCNSASQTLEQQKCLMSCETIWVLDECNKNTSLFMAATKTLPL